MTIEYYSDQSVVDAPRKKESMPNKRLQKSVVQKTKSAPNKSERIVEINGKLVIVKK